VSGQHRHGVDLHVEISAIFSAHTKQQSSSFSAFIAARLEMVWLEQSTETAERRTSSLQQQFSTKLASQTPSINHKSSITLIYGC